MAPQLHGFLHATLTDDANPSTQIPAIAGGFESENV